MDIILFRFINNLAERWTLLDSVGIFFATALIFVMVLGLLALFAFRARLREERHEFATVMIAFLASVCAYAVNFLISLVYFRARPFVDVPMTHLLIIKDATEKSFPSDHAALAFAIAMAVFLAHRRWGIVFLIAAMFVAFGRIFVGVHYPSDVLVGAIIGSAVACIVSKYGRTTFEHILNV